MFNNIIGNDENKKTLENLIKNNSVSHSYIFSGTDGIGKFLFAREFAKSILCMNENTKPCDNCKACESFENKNHPDIFVINEELNTIKTEQIKNLTNDVLKKPILGNKKIYIINNSENMTREAQNSLLKTLEEPPEYILIILITSNENLLLNTIKSRCVKIPFRNLTNSEIFGLLKQNNIEISNDIIDAFGGSIGKALLLRDKQESFNKISAIFSRIENLNELEIFKIKEKIFNDKDDVYFVLEFINTIFYKKIIEEPMKAEKFEKCIESIEDAKIRLKKNCNYDMIIDNLCMQLERSLA